MKNHLTKILLVLTIAIGGSIFIVQTSSCKSVKNKKNETVYVDDLRKELGGRISDDQLLKLAIKRCTKKIILAKRDYFLKGSVILKSNLIIDGNGARIIAPPRVKFHQFHGSNISNVEIKNLIFQGDRKSFKASNFNKFRAYFPLAFNKSKEIKLTSLLFTEQATTCIHLADVENIEIEKCSFENIGLKTDAKSIYSYDCIFIGGYNQTKGVAISNSKFKNIGKNIEKDAKYINDGDGIQILMAPKGRASKITIENCDFQSCSRRGIKAQFGDELLIRNNKLIDCHNGIGLSMAHSLDQVRIINNNFSNCTFPIGTNSHKNNRATVSNLFIEDNTSTKSYNFFRTNGFSSITNGIFKNNTVSELGTYFASGVFLNVTFEQNKILDFGLLKDPSYYMAFLIANGSENVKITNNTIKTTVSSISAIYCQPESKKCLIEDNNLEIPNSGKNSYMIYPHVFKNKSNVIKNNFNKGKKLRESE